MFNLHQIYQFAPPLVQNGLVTASGLLKARQRYGSVYKEHREWLKDFDSWSADQATEYQLDQLQKFLFFAATQSDFYKEFYSECDLSKISSIDDLSSLPILEKETLRREMSRIHTVSRKASTEAHTGGTTGKSLIVRFSYDDLMRRMAMLDHFKARHGFENRKMKRATFSGKHLISRTGSPKTFWRYNAAIKQMLYSTFDMSEQNLDEYVKSLNTFKPDALDGFFTSMCARWIMGACRMPCRR